MNKLNDSVKAVDLFAGTGSIQNLITSVPNTVIPSVDINKISGLSALQNYFNSSAYEKISNIAQSCQEMISSILDSMEDLLNSANQIMMNSLPSMKDFADNALLMTIADEIGFPIYMETNSELQDILIEIYQKNNYRCDKDKMTQTIIDYYDEKYIKAIYDDIEACGVFKPDRIKLIKEGLIVYHLGYYGASASEFILQISGMIHDVYDELKLLHHFTKKEKEGILNCFDQNCPPDGEKSKFLQIVYAQDSGIMIWNHVTDYFLDILYKSGMKDISEYPKRHPMCHGSQLNFNTQEMNLKLIMCMQILCELAWNVRWMKEENAQVVIDL